MSEWKLLAGLDELGEILRAEDVPLFEATGFGAEWVTDGVAAYHSTLPGAAEPRSLTLFPVAADVDTGVAALLARPRVDVREWHFFPRTHLVALGEDGPACFDPARALQMLWMLEKSTLPVTFELVSLTDASAITEPGLVGSLGGEPAAILAGRRSAHLAALWDHGRLCAAPPTCAGGRADDTHLCHLIRGEAARWRSDGPTNTDPFWARIGDLLGTGCHSATGLCRRFGVDPNSAALDEDGE
jgi:hypothetical protein